MAHSDVKKAALLDARRVGVIILLVWSRDFYECGPELRSGADSDYTA